MCGADLREPSPSRPQDADKIADASMSVPAGRPGAQARVTRGKVIRHTNRFEWRRPRDAEHGRRPYIGAGRTHAR